MSGNQLWQRLANQLAVQVDAFPGVAGVAVRDLAGGLELQINGDELFPTASTIKVHVLAQLLVRAEAGEIDLAERIAMPVPDPVLGSGVLAYLQGPLELSLFDMATLMIIASDNVATNICIDRAGMAETNALIHSLGLKSTRLRRKMMDHLAAVREEENVSTPAELVELFRLLHGGKPSLWVAQSCLEILEKPTLGFLERGLPSNIPIANKPGMVEAVRCDAGLVKLPRRPYAIAVMTKYALCDAISHEDFIGRVNLTVYETMAMLDSTNRYGRDVYRQ